MTRSVEIPEAAVEAAIDVVMDDGHNGIQCAPDRNLAVTVRAALEAARPHIEAAMCICPTDAGVTSAMRTETGQHLATCPLALYRAALPYLAPAADSFEVHAIQPHGDVIYQVRKITVDVVGEFPTYEQARDHAEVWQVNSNG